MDIQHLATSIGKEIKRHTPTILTFLGVAGVGATAIMATKAGFKSAEQIVEHEIMTGEVIRDPKTKLDLVWRNYIPAASMALATAAFIIASNTISVKRQSALIGAYALSERALTAYRTHAEENLSPETKKRIKEKEAQTAIEQTPLPDDCLVDIPLNKDIFLDKFTGQYFGSDVETIKDAMTEVNRKSLEEGYASMNYFFSLIGARRTDIGEIMGWTEDRMLDVDLFPLETKDSRPCIVIDYHRMPVMEYHRVY